eukprot:Clim_evm11s7 gene=Clim_evmTU11s7
MPGRNVYVVGVGMTKFEKPGRRANFDYPQMGKEAAYKALKDAGVSYKDIEQVTCGYVYGDSTCGQRAVYELGLTGVPVYNVNNNCSTGSTALFLARQLVAGGLADCALALGFEKMERGSLKNKYEDRSSPMEKFMDNMIENRGFDMKAPGAPQFFGNAGVAHMEKYGTTERHFAKVAYKNHKHSMNNPYSQFRDYYSLEQIEKSPTVFKILTKLQCCPTSDGAGAAVLASEDFVRKHNLQGQAILIAGQAMATDPESSMSGDSMKLAGYDMTNMAARKAFAEAGITPNDVQVVELHDCFSANELITYEGLGLCPPGGAAEYIDSGANTYGGKHVVNPSGGLISKGHPLGATGLAQCAELCWQIRGMAGPRQVPNVKYALQHNLGLGGAAVVTLYKHGFPTQAKQHTGPNPAMDPNVNMPPEEVSAAAGSGAHDKFQAAQVFKVLEGQLKTNGAETVKKTGAIFKFQLKKGSDEAIWVVDLKNGTGTVKRGDGTADCTMKMSDDDFVQLMMGKLDAQKAFFAGKLKIQGNMALAMKLQNLKPAAGAKM